MERAENGFLVGIVVVEGLRAFQGLVEEDFVEAIVLCSACLSDTARLSPPPPPPPPPLGPEIRPHPPGEPPSVVDRDLLARP